jgi:hypothetical protein
MGCRGNQYFVARIQVEREERGQKRGGAVTVREGVPDTQLTAVILFK